VVFPNGPSLCFHEVAHKPEKLPLLPQPVPLAGDKRERIDIPKKPF
jgi:hypothetical protein